MVRRGGKKKRSNMYSVDPERLSVYPSFRNKERKNHEIDIKPGDRLKVRITSYNEDGDATAIYKGYKVLIQNPDAEPGETVEIEVISVQGRTIKGRPI